MSEANNEASKRYKLRHPDKRKETITKYRAKNKDKINESAKRYRQVTKEKRKEYQENYKKKNPRAAVGHHLRKRYGLSLEDYDNLVITQNNRCAICKEEEKEDVRLSVDHCHVTNKVRGLLCKNCNKALGLFRDNADNLVRAIEYLNG